MQAGLLTMFYDRFLSKNVQLNIWAISLDGECKQGQRYKQPKHRPWRKTNERKVQSLAAQVQEREWQASLQKRVNSRQKQSSGAFLQKSCFQNFAKFTGKHPCQSSLFNKVASCNPATLFG